MQIPLIEKETGAGEAKIQESGIPVSTLLISTTNLILQEKKFSSEIFTSFFGLKLYQQYNFYYNHGTF